MIIPALFMLGMIVFGCGTHQQNGTESIGDVNQLDHSGVKQGPWNIFADSVLVAQGTYKDGKPDGLWTYWHKNGQMKEEGRFKEGVKYGIWVEWYPDGEIMWKGEWENGTRHIDHLGANVEVTFIGQDHVDHVLAVDSLYHVKIRIQNIPATNLFVEVNSGEISREGDSDLFILKTSSDSMFTMAIGYVPDLDFMDFRNLVSEIDFKLK